jgi:hypothetical protein
MSVLNAAAFVAVPGVSFTWRMNFPVPRNKRYIDVAEGRISQTCNRTAIMQKLSDFVPALSHHLKPPMRDGSQFTRMLFHPRIDGGIPLDSAVESQQFDSHRRPTF